MTTCEICHTRFQVMQTRQATPDGCSKIKYAFFVVLDLLFFLAILVLLWLAFGWIGDTALNTFTKQITRCGEYGSPTTPCPYFQFTTYSLFDGRIWFWGFIALFFTLGIIGCCCFCCCREKGNELSPTLDDNYRQRGDCWWICCGPSYFGGHYYSTPYGYWTGNDILCCYLIAGNNSCSGCNCGSLGLSSCNGSNCGGSSGSGGGGSNDCGSAILVIIVVVIVVIVVCGVVFGGIIAFLLVNKILRRHLHYLQKKEEADASIIVDLDDPQQIANAIRGDTDEDDDSPTIPLVQFDETTTSTSTSGTTTNSKKEFFGEV